MHALAEYHRPGLMVERPAGTRLGQLRNFLERLWAADPVLTGTGLFLTALLAASAVGIKVDSREITGAPAWLKPAKFAGSTAIYSLTLAWIFTYLPGWTRTRRLVGRATALIFLIELAIIDWQAWRGTTSHFNIGTPLDATLFAVMGTAIVLQTLGSVAVAVAVWRQHFADKRRFKGLENWELEYRAKLVELVQADATLSQKRLGGFISGQGSDPAAPHPYANKQVIAALSKRLGSSPDTVPLAQLQDAAREELSADTSRRLSKP